MLFRSRALSILLPFFSLLLLGGFFLPSCSGKKDAGEVSDVGLSQPLAEGRKPLTSTDGSMEAIPGGEGQVAVEPEDEKNGGKEDGKASEDEAAFRMITD